MKITSRKQVTNIRKGHTLVELVVVVVIMAIMAAVAVPKISNMLDFYQLEQAAVRIVADLNLARTQAKARSINQKVIFDPLTNTYNLEAFADPDHPSQNYSIDLAGPPYELSLISADFSGSPEITFDIYGNPSSAGTVVIQLGSAQSTISVDQTTGEITIL